MSAHTTIQPPKALTASASFLQTPTVDSADAHTAAHQPASATISQSLNHPTPQEPVRERHHPGAQVSLRSEYDITAPTAIYSAQKALLSLLAKLEVRTLTGEIAATIHGNFSLVADYNIDLADGRHFHYACEKFWKGVFSCASDTTTYHLFEHHGTRYSIFQDQTQVAAITRNSFIIGSGYEYDIRMNSDADLLVIACMILALNTDANSDNNNDSGFTWDFGKIGPEDRSFDENWQPS